jgi:HlyD family secretion protein
MTRHALIRILVVLILVGTAVWYFAIRKPEVKTDHGVLSLYGNVDVRLVNLGFQVAGRITRMPYEEGTPVHSGQLLAQLDAVPFQQALNQNVAQLGVQSANLAKLLAGTRVEVIAQSKATVAEREINLANAEAILVKNKAASQIGAVSKQDYENALTQHHLAVAQLQSARQALAEAVNGPVPQDIRASRANLKVAEAAIAQSRTQLRYVQLFAPSDGMVQTRVREPGAVVNQGETVYTLALSTPKWVQTYLEEPDLGRVKPGLKAKVYTDTDPNHPFEGQVGYISSVAEFTPKNVETKNLRTALVYPMRVMVIDPKNSLRQGMPVTVRIQTGLSRPVTGQGP